MAWVLVCKQDLVDSRVTVLTRLVEKQKEELAAKDKLIAEMSGGKHLTMGRIWQGFREVHPPTASSHDGESQSLHHFLRGICHDVVNDQSDANVPSIEWVDGEWDGFGEEY